MKIIGTLLGLSGGRKPCPMPPPLIPGLWPRDPRAARDVSAGQSWIFRDHRTMAEVIRDERQAAGGDAA